MNFMLSYITKTLGWGLFKVYLQNTICRIYDSYPGVCDQINARKDVRFQISPSVNEQKSGINTRFHKSE